MMLFKPSSLQRLLHSKPSPLILFNTSLMMVFLQRLLLSFFMTLETKLSLLFPVLHFICMSPTSHWSRALGVESGTLRTLLIKSFWKS